MMHLKKAVEMANSIIMKDIHKECVLEDFSHLVIVILSLQNDVSYIPWYLTCRKPGCIFVGMVRILNDNTRVGFSTTEKL